MENTEEIIIHSHNKDQAQKVRKMAIGQGCEISSTEFPDDSGKGIKQRFKCRRGVSNKLIEDVKEPGFLERVKPDKFKTQLTEHNLKKKRKFF